MLETLEAFTQMRIRTNMETFAEHIGKPHEIARTWNLGRRWFSKDETTENQARQREPKDASHVTGGVTETELPYKGPSDALTPREADVATLVAKGMSNRKVATELGLQESTVRNVLSRSYTKLGIASRAELIVLFAQTATAIERPHGDEQASNGSHHIKK